MELDFNKIIRLKKIRIEKSELSEEENALTTPILKDKSLIHEIYKIFVELLNERGCPPNIDSVTQRQLGYAKRCQGYLGFSPRVQFPTTALMSCFSIRTMGISAGI